MATATGTTTLGRLALSCWRLLLGDMLVGVGLARVLLNLALLDGCGRSFGLDDAGLLGRGNRYLSVDASELAQPDETLLDGPHGGLLTPGSWKVLARPAHVTLQLNEILTPGRDDSLCFDANAVSLD